jgi:replicative DNA helicase
MDVGAIVLHKLLKEQSLEGWARIRLAFLDPAYSNLYTAINRFYSKYNSIPSFEDLELSTRDTPLSRALSSLKDLEVPDVDIDVAIDALVDTYTQTEALKLLDKFVDNVTLLGAQEIKDQLSGIVIKLDDLTHTSESVIAEDGFVFFEDASLTNDDRTPLGINNTLDAITGGAHAEELILIGGKRGHGKSVVCTNLCVNQVELGNVVPYFTIEMTAKEVTQRRMSIQAGVSHAKIRNNTLEFADQIKLVQTRASMFLDADHLVDEFLHHKDPIKFETELLKTKKSRENQVIIIDDRELSLAAVDLHLQKLKAKYGDKLKMAVIDYLNQIVVPGQENMIYEWTTQITISKKLKEYARKYGIAIISPYQIDDNGSTRFAKGILDACDVALLLEAHDKDDGRISFETTKIRGASPVKCTSSIDWETLKIDPVEAAAPAKKLKAKEKESTQKEPTNDGGDLPW